MSEASRFRGICRRAPACQPNKARRPAGPNLVDLRQNDLMARWQLAHVGQALYGVAHCAALWRGAASAIDEHSRARNGGPHVVGRVADREEGANQRAVGQRCRREP